MGGEYFHVSGDQVLNLRQRHEYTDTFPGTQYHGLAAPGTLDSDAGWVIRRETLDASGRTTHIDFAGGTVAFINIWDNRASLDYK